MNGGLRALVSATRATTARLEPRPVSRFEAEPLAVNRDAPDVVEVAERRPEPTVYPARAATHTDGSSGVAEAVPAAPALVSIRPPDRRQPLPVPQRRDQRPPLAPPAALPQGPGPKPETIVSAAAPTTRLQPPSPPGDSTKGAARKHHPDTDTVRPVSVRHGRPVQPDTRPEGVLVASLRHPLPTAPAVRTPPARRRSGIPAPAPQQPQPPDIHVSIGRIEVRATPAGPTAPREPRAATSPVIGLDDYLAERGAR